MGELARIGVMTLGGVCLNLALYWRQPWLALASGVLFAVALMGAPRAT